MSLYRQPQLLQGAYERADLARSDERQRFQTCPPMPQCNAQ
jgi:hypothetical protein